MIDKNNYSPIPTGFTELDTALGGGLPRGVVTILTSPFTAEGKTSFAISMLRHALHQPAIQSMLFFLEGSQNDVVTKLLAMETGIDTMDMDAASTTEEEDRRLQEAHQNIREEQLWIDDRSMKSVAVLRERIAMVFGDGFPDLLMLDYLDLMGTEGYEGILAGLRLLARSSSATILVVAHTIERRLPQEMLVRNAHALLILDREEQSREAWLEVRQVGHTVMSIPLYFYPPTTRFFNSAEEFQQVYQHARLKK